METKALITQHSYNAAGNQTQAKEVRLPAGDAPDTGGTPGTTATAYDALNRPQKVTDPSGPVTQYTYDEFGRVTAITKGPESNG